MEDTEVSRSAECTQLAKIFLSVLDELRKRKYDKFTSIEVSQRFVFNYLAYKAGLEVQEQIAEQQNEIIFNPEDLSQD